jgi:hypothetical protein
MVRSISIYQPRNGIGGERELNQCHLISRQRKNKIIAKREEALQGRGGEEAIILSYNMEDILEMENKEETKVKEQ